MKSEWRRRALNQWRGVEEDCFPKDTSRSIGDLMPEVMKSLGLTERFAEEEISRAWIEVVGYPFCQQVVPTKLSRGVLHVRVLQPTIQYAFEGVKTRFLPPLQERLGRQRLKEIRVVRR